jgi:hypothetical protein
MTLTRIGWQIMRKIAPERGKFKNGIKLEKSG